MSNLTKLAAALFAVGVAASMSAFAGDTARTEERRDPQWDNQRAMQKAPVPKYTAAIAAARSATRDGFEFVGGDAGWQLAQHKYVLSAGAFTHSAECDHVMRAAAATPTPADLERNRQLYPGG